MSQEKPRILVEHSKSNHKTIKVNGIYIHSRYNPVKEAKSFATASFDENASGYLVLGSGLGYHIDELQSLLEEAGQTHKRIFVIEPNADVFELADTYFDFTTSMKNRFYTDIEFDELFFNEEFVSFLAMKPKILIHPASYNANKAFFESFLTYKCKNSYSEYSEYRSAAPCTEDLKKDLKNVRKDLQKQTKLTNDEQLLLATYEFLG
ncbi:MAG: hypothetical protein ACPGJV_11725 [Bacteriovoracaceae bacterium]